MLKTLFKLRYCSCVVTHDLWCTCCGILPAYSLGSLKILVTVTKPKFVEIFKDSESNTDFIPESGL